MRVINLRRGTKAFLGFVKDDNVVFQCGCEVFRDAMVVVKMTVAQGEELLLPRGQRRSAKEILASHPREVRELFESGITPAEADRMCGGISRDIRDYPCYEGGGTAVVKASAGETMTLRL